MQTLSVYAAIGWLYMATNSARIISYLPQIIAVYRCDDGARSISLLTWTFWCVSHLAALLYGAVVIRDVFFCSVSAMNCLCTGIVSVLAFHRRRQWQQRSPGCGGVRVAAAIRRTATTSGGS